MDARRNQDPKSAVRDIRRNTMRKFSSEEKIRIVLESLKGEVSIAELSPWYARLPERLCLGSVSGVSS